MEKAELRVETWLLGGLMKPKPLSFSDVASAISRSLHGDVLDELESEL